MTSTNRVTVEELVVSFGFDAKKALQALEKTEKVLNNFIDKVKDINIEVNADTGAAQRQFNKLEHGLTTLATMAGKTTRALEKIGIGASKGLYKAIKLSSTLAGKLMKVGSITVGGAVAGATAVNANVAAKANEANAVGSDYKTVSALAKAANVEFDQITDIMEEMNNKIQLTFTSLQRDLKAGAVKISEFDINGYINDKGKKQDKKKLEEATLDDLLTTAISAGDLAKIDKSFKGITNSAEAFYKFEKMSKNDQFILMAKLVELNKKYAASMDDAWGGDSQKMFTKMADEAKRLGVTVERLIKMNLAKQFITDDDVKAIQEYNRATKDTGGIIAGITKKLSAGIGDVLTPYLEKFNNFVYAHKEQITQVIESLTTYIKTKLSELEAWLSGKKGWIKDNLFDEGQFIGIEATIAKLKAAFEEAYPVLAKFAENFKIIVAVIVGAALVNKIAEIVAALAQFKGALSLLFGLTPQGLALKAAIAGIALAFANWDTIKEWINSTSNYLKDAFDKWGVWLSELKQKFIDSIPGGNWASEKFDELSNKAGKFWDELKAGSPSLQRLFGDQTTQVAISTPKIPTPTIQSSTAKAQTGSTIPMNVHNGDIKTEVHVNVTGTNATADEIARKTAMAIEADAMKKNMTTVQKTPNL